MLLRDTFLAVLRDQRTPSAPDPEVARTLSDRLPKRTVQALVLTGVRRSGKSTLQAQLMRRKDALYCNFEDTRLFGLGPADFSSLLSVIEEMAPVERPVFLDEVQEVPEWQRLVRSLLDRGYSVCLTGSNASLLGRDLGSKLTGRHLSFEVFPFDYSEFLAFTGRKPETGSLREFLDSGGFPGFLRERDPRLLQELLRDIVQRDIAQKHHLRETRHVMNLALFLLGHTGQPFSLQTLTKALAVPTVGQTSRYLEFLQDAYLLFAVPKFSQSFKQRVVAPNKYYAIDNGLRVVNSPQQTADVGRRLENAVFLALRQQGKAVTYAAEKDAWECDFVTENLAVQVCLELNPGNLARELRGLQAALALPGKRQGVIVTLEQKDRLKIEGQSVPVVPAWEWLGTLGA